MIKINQYAIIIPCYLRFSLLKKTISSLQKNNLNNTKIFFFIDGPKNSNEELIQNKIYIFLNNLKINKIIIKRKKNLGLAKNIIKSINEVFKTYKYLIVIEDDLLLSKYFVSYMKKILTKFEKNKKIMSVSGHNFNINFDDQKDDILLSNRANCWGWATWRNRWFINSYDENIFFRYKKIKNNFISNDIKFFLLAAKFKLISSWATIWAMEHFKKKNFCIIPRKSLVVNKGDDILATHAVTQKKNEKLTNKWYPKNLNINKNIDINHKIFNHYSYNNFYLFLKYLKIITFFLVQKFKF
jgi:hypothetical protein